MLLARLSKDQSLFASGAAAPFDILDSLPVATIAIGLADQRLIYANAAFLRQFGAPGDTVAAEFVYPDDRPTFLNHITGFSSQEGPKAANLRLCRPNEHEVWVSAFFSRLPASASPNACIVVQCVDIDLAKRASAELRERESRWNSALIGSGLGVWDHDFTKGRMFYSETWRKIRGYRSDRDFDAALENWILCVHPDDRENVLRSIERQNAGDPDYATFVYRERHKDGHWVWIECRGACVEWDENGTATRIIGTDTDISERKAAEELLAHTSRRLDLALGISRIGVFEADLESGEIDWDDRLLSIYGLENTPHMKPSGFWEATIHPEDRDQAIDHVNANVSKPDGFAQEYRIVRPDGSIRVVRARAAPFVDGNGRSKVIGANWDVTDEVTLRQELKRAKELAEARNVELETAKEQIEHVALHDHLTGLPNRYYLDRILTARAEECRADGAVLAILHIDLDRFKQINDTLGHRAGDKMLQHVAAILRESLSSGDFVARIGGDEFVIVCKRRTFSRKISSLATHIIRELRKPVRYDNHDVRFGASIGVSFDSGAHLDAKQLLLNADIALYRAKDSGRNRHEFFSLDARQHILATKRLSDEILTGIERGEFIPYYQPQFSARTLDVVGAETLIRWHHPARGLLTPDKFLAAAEDLDIVATLDGLVLEKALADQRQWIDAGIAIPKISVNVSARRLADPNLGRTLRALKIKPGTISFELLESISLDHCDEASATNLERLRRLGIDIEIDDFGTGHASIVSLLRLSPKTLKIDRELIRPLPGSAEQRRLVGSIIEIGRSQNIEVTAEGVETMEHAHILADLGCDSLQGYALARPMPGKDIPAFIRNESWRSANGAIQVA